MREVLAGCSARMCPFRANALPILSLVFGTIASGPALLDLHLPRVAILVLVFLTLCLRLIPLWIPVNLSTVPRHSIRLKCPSHLYLGPRLQPRSHAAFCATHLLTPHSLCIPRTGNTPTWCAATCMRSRDHPCITSALQPQIMHRREIRKPSSAHAHASTVSPPHRPTTPHNGKQLNTPVHPTSWCCPRSRGWPHSHSHTHCCKTLRSSYLITAPQGAVHLQQAARLPAHLAHYRVSSTHTSW